MQSADHALQYNVVQHGITQGRSTAHLQCIGAPCPQHLVRGRLPSTPHKVCLTPLKHFKHSQRCNAAEVTLPLLCSTDPGSCRAQAQGSYNAPITLSSTSFADFRAPPSAASCSDTDMLFQNEGQDGGHSGLELTRPAEEAEP